MNILKFAFFFLSISIISSCSVTKMQKKGEVSSENFNSKLDFISIKNAVIFPVEIDGVSKNFLFDTGAQVSIIQRDTMIGSIGKYTGASKRKMKLGNEIVKSIKIGEADFQNTYAVNGDLVGLKEQIPNFGGLIGQPIISKANWLINYPEKTIRVSNENLVDNTFETIKLKREGGSPFTYIEVNGLKHKVIIDLGSISELNLPQNSSLAKQLSQQYHFTDQERERYTLGGLQKITEKVGFIPSIKMGGLEFKNVRITLNVSSQPRIGIGFFTDCEIYIDNKNNVYRIKK